MNSAERAKLAEIITDLTDAGHWKTIVATELIDALATWLAEDATCIHPECGIKTDLPNEGYSISRCKLCFGQRSFDPEAWKLAARGE